MARVNVDQKAFTDSRFVELGRLIGANRHEALGRMILVWNECQERNRVVLSKSQIDNTNPDIPDFTFLILKAELAVQTKHGFKVRGAKGRIEWLGKARKHGKLGGRPRKNQTVAIKNRVGVQKNNPPAPAPAPAPAQSSSLRSDKQKNAREIVEGFALEQKHLEWGKKNTPSVPLDDELEAWRDRLRASNYRYGKPPGILVADAQASFYTSCRNAEKWGIYKNQHKEPQNEVDKYQRIPFGYGQND